MHLYFFTERYTGCAFPAVYPLRQHHQACHSRAAVAKRLHGLSPARVTAPRPSDTMCFEASIREAAASICFRRRSARAHG